MRAAASRAANAARHMSTEVAVRSQDAKAAGAMARFFDLPKQNSLDEVFPGTPKATPQPALAPTEVKTTKLANGLRVVSLDTHGNNASLGFYVGAGSRADVVHGTAHVLQAMAFRSTSARSTYKLRRDIDNFGGSFSATAGREGTAYGMECLRDELPLAADALSEAVMQPRITAWEVSEVLAGDLETGTPAGLGSTADEDLIHAAAYGLASPLGHAFAAEEANYGALTADTLRSYLGAQFVSGNAVIVANNVPHEPLVDMMDATFLGLPSGESHATPSPFEGGSNLVRAPGATTVMVGLKGAAANSKAARAAEVLAAIIGRAPVKGKEVGMFGCKAVEVMSRGAAAGITGFEAFNFSHSDSGLFGIKAVAGSSAAVASAIDIAADVIKAIAGGAVEEREVKRAVAACKMAFAARADTRAGRRDIIAESVLATGTPGSVAATLAEYDSITAADVAAVAKAGLAADPALGVRGALESVPRFDRFASKFQ
ncbi:hypothetical protein FNF31_03954 [Cafeteria roenbergensis]|uniref:Peptidase M16 N-terminal domain-containing protein n=1 Tax=Cafeteria roenbergensis TaxID=33653 RepID=A0A5A8D6N3_CAFRO|nr:hypothetical protein FNF31_03954 [Cafeteria roenbergensis]KAA0170873.1 hypothetical protein FNF28_01146 [Cafeteria roenbergensis]